MFIPTHITTTDPTVTDGISAGFLKGTYWLNTSTTELFICEDDSNTAAVWTSVSGSSTLTYVKVSLDSTAVSNLGTPQQLIAAPGTGKYIEVVSIGWVLTVTTPIDAGSQTLEIGYKTGEPIFSISNTKLESISSIKMTLNKVQNVEFAGNDPLYTVVSGGTPPSSGSATMDFYILYKTITL